MRCSQVQSLLSPYLDGQVTGKQMQGLSRHLSECEICSGEFEAVRRTQQLLAQAARREAPADLSLKLRLAISREHADRGYSSLENIWFRVDNAARALLFPAMAGLVTAVFIFGMFMGFSAIPLRAGNPDVPLMLNTAPELEESAFGTAMNSVSDDSLVIEAYVNSNGRVDDYRILSDSQDSDNLTPQIKNMLINFMTFTTFRPATSNGRRIPGRAILSFSKVSVKG